MQTKWKSQLDPILVGDGLINPFKASGSGSTISTSAPIVIFPNVLFGDGSNYGGSTGVFTVPSKGTYRIGAFLETVSTSWTAGNILELYIQVNGAIASFLSRVVLPTATAIAGIGGSDQLQLNAGDQVTINCFSSVTTTISHGTGAALSANYFNINQVA